MTENNYESKKKKPRIIIGALKIAEFVRSFSTEDPSLGGAYVEIDEEGEIQRYKCQTTKGYAFKIRAHLFTPIGICTTRGEFKCFKNCGGYWEPKMREILKESRAVQIAHDEMYEYYTLTLPRKKK